MTAETKNKLTLKIRPMTLADIASIAELEKQLFPDPWPESAFKEQLTDPGWGSIVAETDDRIIGYGCYFIVADESHLTNIAVVEEFRRKSVAKQILENILLIVNEAKCEFLLLEVRPSNENAIAFYEKYGFKFLYQRPNYYRKPKEDARVLVKYLENESE